MLNPELNWTKQSSNFQRSPYTHILDNSTEFLEPSEKCFTLRQKNVSTWASWHLGFSCCREHLARGGKTGGLWLLSWLGAEGTGPGHSSAQEQWFSAHRFISELIWASWAYTLAHSSPGTGCRRVKGMLVTGDVTPAKRWAAFLGPRCQGLELVLSERRNFCF